MPSKNENAVASLLSSIPLPFKREYTFPDLKGQKGHPYRFDFAILSPFGGVAYLIEVNGEQHYEAVSQFGGVRGRQPQDSVLPRTQHSSFDNSLYCNKNFDGP